jgi:hypothetical protein
MRTTYSRRELYALGESLGESVTRKEGGRIIYGGGGSGGGGQPTQTTSTSYQTNIPEYARPYVETMLGATQKQLFQGTPTEGGGFDITGFQPYRAYGGTYDEQGNQTSYDPSKGIAGFQPMQTQAQQGIANMQVPGQYDQATNATRQSMQNLQNAGYQGGDFGNQFQAPSQYQPGQFSVMQAQAPNLQNYQMQGPQNVQTQSFANPYSAQAYMSPYMQNVVGIQQREAQRAADVAKTGRNAQAVGAGAFGGSRQAIMDAEAERNLATQKGDIQAQGLQSAYGQAQGQFNAEQQARLQAQMANQQAGINVGGQNLSALLGIQQLGAGQNLQSQLANQQAGMAAQQAAEQSRQYGAGLGMTAAQQRAQYGLSGQQLGEQSRQYGAGYGLQANQIALGAANQLAGLGQQELASQQGIYNLQNAVGAQQQALEQQKLNQGIQDYANAQQYPLMQLGTMSNMIRGLPMQASTSNQYVAQPNTLTQAIGAAGTGASLYNAFNPTSKAEGGIISVPRYDVGGEVESDLEGADDSYLQKQLKESSSPSVKRMAQRILRERQMSKAPGMAGGGIIAFKEPTEENNQSLVTEPKPTEQAPPTSSEILQQRVLQAKPTGDVTAQPAGIIQAAPPPPSAPAPTAAQAIQAASDLSPAMKAIQAEADAAAKVSAQDIYARKQEERKAAGIGEPGVEQRAKLMAERANAADEAERTKNLRMAEFFSRWGSTPGPTLVAGMQAVKASVPDLISDQKEAKKIRMEIDKSLASLDEATRLEKKGDMDAATAEKQKAAEIAKSVNMEVIKIQEQESVSKRRAEEARAHDVAMAKRSEEHDIRYGNLHKETTQMQIDSNERIKKLEATWRAADKTQAGEDRLLKIWEVANQNKQANEAKIANIMKSPEYDRAVRDANMDITADSSPAVIKMQRDGKAALDALNKSFETMRTDGERGVDFATDRLKARKIEVPTSGPKLSTEDQSALNWANDPKSPGWSQEKADAIKKTLKVR